MGLLFEKTHIFIIMRKTFLICISCLLIQSCSKSDITTPTGSQKPNPPASTTQVVTSTEKLDARIVNTLSLSESINRGLTVYTNSLDDKGDACMHCHVSKDGYDIALFNNTDSIPFMNRVFHRALKHVSTDDAIHVMNYIKSLTKTIVIPRNSTKDVYQPGSAVVTESQFANSIGLGNASYSFNQIDAWDFTQIKVPITLPGWVDTSTIIDILPEKPIQLLKNNNPIVKAAYQQYLSNPSDENFVRFKRVIFNTLTAGEKHPGEHGYNDFKESYNTMKWLSSAYIQHVIRYKNNQFGPFNIFVDGRNSDNIYESVLDPIWFAGDIARRSLENGSVSTQLQDRDEIRSTWLYLGWIGNYGKTANFESKYISDALMSKNFQFLTQAVIMKSLINRPNNVQALYDDVRSAGKFIEPSTGNFDKCLDFMLSYIINKQNTNYQSTVVTGDDKKWSLEDLISAKSDIEKKAGSAKNTLINKIDQIIASVNAM